MGLKRPLVAAVAWLGAGAAVIACSLLVDTDDLGSSTPPTADSGSSSNETSTEASTDGGGAVDVVDAGPVFNLGCDAPGLAAAWMFDEGTGVVARDCTGHGFEATLGDDAGWTAGHDGGSALKLEGNAWAECAKRAELNFTGPISIAAWVNLTSIAHNGRIFASSLFGSDTGLELTFEVGPRDPPGDLRERYWSLILGIAPADSLTVDGLGNKGAFVWTHVAATYDGTTASIFVDGNLEGTSQIPNRRVSAQPFYIGRRTDCCYFRGSIDDLRVYARALPADEVRALSQR